MAAISKYIYGSILLAAVASALYFLISNYKLDAYIHKQDAKIVKLDAELSNLKKETLVLKQDVALAETSFSEQKKRAEAAEKKLAALKPVVIPTTATATISVECLEQLHLVQQQYEVREVVFLEVIEEQKHTIASAELVIAKLKQEVATGDSIIATHEEKDTTNNAKIVALNDKVQKQESAKKVYRTSTVVLGTVLLILLL